MNAIRTIERGNRRVWLLGMLLVVGAISSHAAHSQTSNTTPAATKESSDQVYASPSQVRIIQEKLRAQGRNIDVDGVWDEDTMASVRDYQKSKGLPTTGQLDTSLLSALELGDVLQGKTSSDFLGGLLRSSESDIVSKGQGAPLYVSPTHVAQIQQLLKKRDFYSGAIDGVWGASTARAANQFRVAQGLEASEGLDIGLLRALSEQSGAASDAPQTVAARTSGVPLQAGPVAIRSVQRQLANKGHEAGAIDGVWGESTRQALREFQKEKDLEATGTLTLPTLTALGIDLAGEHSDSQFESERQRGTAGQKTDPADSVASETE